MNPSFEEEPLIPPGLIEPDVNAAGHWLRERLRQWPDVTVREHPDRGLRFCTPRGEFLHFHGDQQVDIRLSLPDRDRALEDNPGWFHPRSHEGGWIMVRLKGVERREVLRLAAAAYRWRLRHCPCILTRSRLAEGGNDEGC